MKTSISIRTILVFLCFCFVMLPLVACEEKKANTNTNTNTTSHYPITESEAIAKAKTRFTLTGEDKIAKSFAFKSHYSPHVGSIEASWTRFRPWWSEGIDCWKVSIYGNMSGYTDKYQTKFETKKFEYRAYIDDKGSLLAENVY